MEEEKSELLRALSKKPNMNSPHPHHSVLIQKPS